MPRLLIQPVLLSLLKSGRFQQFTIPLLRDSYLALRDCPHDSAKAAQQYIYKNVLRMEAAGLVERTNTRNGKNILFRLDPSFAPKETAHAIIDDAVDLDKGVTATSPIIKTLRDKLNRYKLELLSALGETEEYDALSQEVPQLKQEIQALYNEVRDKSSKLLGKMKALEFLLTRYQSL